MSDVEGGPFLDVGQLYSHLLHLLAVSCDDAVPVSRDRLMDVIDVLNNLREQGVNFVPSTKEG